MSTPLRRQRLQPSRWGRLTPDTLRALSSLEEAAFKKGGWRLSLVKSPPGQDVPPESLLSAGREVLIRLTHPDKDVHPQRALDALWGFAVPAGFTPRARYPLLSDPHASVFHYLGPWGPLYERVIAEGKGHLAWPSVCAAARVDVGAWEGANEEAVFVQAQLHRIGHNPGPVDGVIGERTLKVMRSLGLGRPSLAKVVEHLKTALPPKAPPAVQRQAKGHITIPGRALQVQTYGGVVATRQTEGVSLKVTGPGRVVVDIGDST